MRIEFKYPAILCGYLDSWLFCTVKETCLSSRLRATLLYPLCLPRLMRNEEKDLAEKKSSWIINNLLDVLVCLYELCKIQTTKILSYTTHQNV